MSGATGSLQRPPAVGSRQLMRGRRGLAARSASLLFVAGLGAAYALCLAPGLPYDEPSHWGYVQWLANHGTLPVLGEPSVSYEAQMGPVSYLLPAIVVRAVHMCGASPDLSLLLARLAGVLPLLALAAAVRKVVRLSVPRATESLVLAGVALAVLNPMVVAMSMSVQNDTIALGLACWLLVLVMGLDSPPGPVRALALGALGGLAVLAKLSVLPAVILLLAWPAVRWRRAGMASAGAAACSAAAVAAWWFVRNVVLYGDWTARAGVEQRLGLQFPPLGLDPLHATVHLGRSVIAYLWVPVEYCRNLINLPTVLAIAVSIVTAAVVAMGTRSIRGHVQAGQVAPVLAVALLSVVVWAWTAEFEQAVAFRTAYLALPAYAILVALAGDRLGHRRFVGGAVALLLAVHAWTLLSLAGVSYPPGLTL